jgi:hypothetical protein
MVVDWPPVVRSVVAVLPPMAALTLALGPYDGYFDDREIFLLFLVGLGLGLLVGVLEVSLLVVGQGFSPLYVLGAPLVAQLGKAVVLNLPRFQQESGTVFLGAAVGTGVGATVLFGYGQVDLFLDPTRLPTTAATFAGVAVGAGALHVATGALVGDYVAQGTPFRGLAVAAVATVPVAFATSAHVAFRASFTDRVLWSAATLVYGVAGFLYARTRVFERGLTDDQRRARRREIRDAS